MNTGPRFCTRSGSLPSKAGNRFGTTRTSQVPLGPYVSSAGGVGLLVPGAERALAVGIGLDRELPGDELTGAGGALDGDRDPAPRQRVQAELTHGAAEPGDRTVRTLPRP